MKPANEIPAQPTWLPAGKRHPINRSVTCLFLCVLPLLLACFLPGCAARSGSSRSLYAHGLDVIGLMEEMVKSSSYGELYGMASGEIEALRDKLAVGDYATPQAVYEITVPDTGKLLALLGENNPLDSFSDSLRTFLNSRAASSLANQLNARQGSAALATASVYMASKTFVSSSLDHNTLYLYTFQKGHSVMVSFVAGEDHSVTATGVFLMAEDFSSSSVEQLEELLKGIGITGAIQEVEKAP